MRLNFFLPLKLVFMAFMSILFYSCEENVQQAVTEEPSKQNFFVDVSECTLVDSLLKDGDVLEILASSGNISSSTKMDFYLLFLVKSLRTGDTLNVLSTNFYKARIDDPQVNFVSQDNVMGKIIGNIDQINENESTPIAELKEKNFDKVYYDTDYIQVDVRKYPAVIGSIGDKVGEGDISNVLNKLDGLIKKSKDSTGN